MSTEFSPLFLARLKALREDDPLLTGFRDLLVALQRDAQEESHVIGRTADDRAFLDGRASALADALDRLQAAYLEASEAPKNG